LTVHTPDGPAEVRFRIATAAFAANRVLLQDGPDVCYQLLLRMVADAAVPIPDEVTVDDAALAAYREAHTPVPRRSAAARPSPKPAPFRRAPVPETHPKLPVAPSAGVAPTFDEGQRVSHAVFGTGVTMGSQDGYTSVQFDEHGTRTFVTSMLELETLSPPHTWEVGPRGKNRLRDSSRGQD